MNSLVIIPSRFDSSRLPGKPLLEIDGKTLIQRVYDQVRLSRADDIIVATDDKRIFEHVLEFGGNVVMTSEQLRNGTERIIEAADKVLEDDDEYDMIINVQGDEPLIDPEDINSLIDLFDEEECDIGTLASRITNQDELHSADTVKVVLSDFEDEVADALYFSRAPIPYMRDEDPQNWLDHHIYYKHIGLYAFAPEVLESIKALGESSLEIAENLEQLRWLENHFVISVKLTENESIGVDTAQDLEYVEKLLKRR